MKSTNQTTKKSRTRKSSISDNTTSDASDERKGSVNNQTAQENSTPSKTSREEKNEELKEVRNCRKREGSGASDKIQRKSTRVNAVTRDKETAKVPFSTNKGDWTQSGSGTANEFLNNNSEQNYENESLETNRKKSTERKNKSRSPLREKNTSNKKEEGMVPLEGRGKKSSQYTRNNYNPPREQERNSRNDSSDIHRHDCNVRSRSPIHFDSEKNDLHNKPRTDKARYKRSHKTNVLKKHRSNSRSRQASAMENESQEFQPTEDKGSSVLTNEDYSKVSHSEDSGKDPPRKQNSVQTSTKPNLLGSAFENSRTHQKDSSSVKSKKIEVKSLELRSKTLNFRENSSKVSKKSKTERWMKRQRNGKEAVSGRKQNERDTVAKYEGQNRRKTKKKLLKSTTRKKS